MSEIVTTAGLCKQSGKVMRVKDLDLKVPEHVVYGFLGPNGAGKSTTMKLLLGLARPTAGRITLFGKQMDHKNRIPILRKVGSLIESPSYYGHLTGMENLRIISTLKGVPDIEIDRVLKIVHLEKQKEKKVEQYSQGMKQRLGIACALLGNPKLLILDEPTNGLDPAGIQEMRELIGSLPKEWGMTVMISSHLLSEIEQIAGHVGIISRGELIFQDSMSSLHEKNRHNLAVRTLNNEAAAILFAEQGIPCQARDGYLLLPRLSDKKLTDSLFKLFERQIGVVRIEERQKTLENIFLELTGTEVSLS